MIRPYWFCFDKERHHMSQNVTNIVVVNEPCFSPIEEYCCEMLSCYELFSKEETSRKPIPIRVGAGFYAIHAIYMSSIKAVQRCYR